MNALEEFAIPFKGLKFGTHAFRFEIASEFWQCFDKTEIHDSQLPVQVELDRRPDLLVLTFDLKGAVYSPCDRCLQPIPLSISSKRELMVKFAEDVPDTDEVVYLSSDISTINIAQYIYEFAHLALPMRRVRDCESNNYADCDQTVLDRLDTWRTDSTDDSVWNELKKLDLKQ